MRRARRLCRAVVDEWRHIGRHPSVLLILFGIVAFYPLVVSHLYERDSAVERPTVLIDADATPLSWEVARRLDATQGLRIERRLDSLDEGFERVRDRRSEVLVYVPEGFSRDVKSGRPTRLTVWLDSANMLTYGVAWPALLGVVGSLNEELGARMFLSNGAPSALAREKTMPIARDDRLLFHPTASYGNFLVTGVFVIVLQQVILIALAFSVGLRREEGTFDERSPHLFSDLTGKALAQLLFYLAGVAFVAFVVFPRFGWSVTDEGALALVLASFAVAVMPLAILVAAFVPDRYAAFQTLMFVSTPLYLVSGFTWPLEQMPRAIQLLAGVFPSTPALLALRTLSMKTADWSLLWPHLEWLAGLFALHLALAIALVRWRGRWARRAAAAGGGMG